MDTKLSFQRNSLYVNEVLEVAVPGPCFVR
jgi:hypothetical protein